jgi:peptidoglycan/xylan/chitin deacetylase (PgdA/CDA1 family)
MRRSLPKPRSLHRFDQRFGQRFGRFTPLASAAVFAAIVLVVVVTADRDEDDAETATAASFGAALGNEEQERTVAMENRGPPRRPIRGVAFPDGVLALTWDDGPDANTIELAKYLQKEHVSATFFVVGEWIEGLSMEPGTGQDTFGTGYKHMPVLSDLLSLGHRVGAHTVNHVLLTEAPSLVAREQIEESVRAIPAQANELLLFRAPGGAWNDEVATAITDVTNPLLTNLVGPVGWDIDAKDWDASLYCRSSLPSECEPSPVKGETRVRPDVVARRYLAQIEETRHGIVLMHDRVGHVGSHYAVDLAKVLIPSLIAKGYVFAAPVLGFSPFKEHASSSPAIDAPAIDDVDAQREWRAHFGDAKKSVRFGDLNGDGHTDACLIGDDGNTVNCALFDGHHFKDASPWASLPALAEDASSMRLVDVNGDHRADLCVTSSGRALCALAP